MSKTSKSMFVLAVASVLTLAACGSNAPKNKGLEITTMPTKTSYYVGDTFDPSGLVVSRVLSDDSKVALAANEYTLSNPDMASAGEKTVVATYLEFTADFKITVAAIEPESIAVTANPTTTTYFVDDDFDPTGLEVTVTMNNGTTQVLDAADYTLSEPDMSTAGEKTITVSYAGLTATFNILVNDDNVASIALTAPSKVSFERNEELKLSGLSVIATFDSGARYDVTNYVDIDASAVDMSKVGEYTITVSFAGLEESFKINVVEPHILALEVMAFPAKTIYEVGEDLDFDGLKVGFKWSDFELVFDEDDPTKLIGRQPRYVELSEGDFQLSTVSTAEAGQKVVTITSGNYTTSFNIGVLGAVTYTYNDYTAVSPSNWNELTYQDNNDTQIMSFLAGSFFTFNFKFEDDKIVDGDYSVEYDGVKKLEDVTATYAGNEKYAVPAEATKGFAYKFTLREDLKWDDGTPIKAEDFVYTMKEQENPLFFNYRADSYYTGDTIIHNAQSYLKQGQSGWFASKNVFASYSSDCDDQMIFNSYLDTYSEAAYLFSWFRGDNGADYDAYFVEGSLGIFAIPALYGVIGGADARAYSAALDGKTFAEIKADPALLEIYNVMANWWIEVQDENLDFFVTHYTYPAVDFNDVGILVGDKDNELIVVLDKALQLFKDDGVTLSYKAAYNFSSLPLVKRDLYENCKVAPQLDGGLWTSKYNSSVDTSASWGPYKLTYFQAGKQYVLDRNPNWYGYNMPEYEGQYQTDRIVCDTISSWNTAWLAFQQGDLLSIGIDVSIADDYRNSSRARFTADDFISSLQLQSRVESLKERSNADHNKMLLAYKDFRQAISLGIDRAAYVQETTTACLPGFGIFNSMHYYDVENGGVYRNEDVAKEVICEVYGVDIEEYDSLDEAYAAVTGYNLDLARELLTEAYEQGVEDGVIGANDKVVLTVGAATDNETVRRQFDFLKKSIETLALGTPLEGRFTLELDTSFGSSWANSFRDGEYDICTGGWSGAAWNPGYFLLAYLSPDYMYSQGWETDKEELTYNPWNDGEEDHNLTMSLIDWYYCLNGAEGAAFDWSDGGEDDGYYTNPAFGLKDGDEHFGEKHPVATQFRLGIIAQLEKAVLSVYYTCPMYNFFSAALTSYKIEQGTKNYNTFMGYGGLRYIHYNYTDAEWAAVKSSFDYKD